MVRRIYGGCFKLLAPVVADNLGSVTDYDCRHWNFHGRIGNHLLENQSTVKHAMSLSADLHDMPRATVVASS